MKNLRMLRIAKGAKSVDVANYIGVSKECYNVGEKQNGQFWLKKPDRLKKIAEFFDMNPFDMLAEDNFRIVPKTRAEKDELIKVIEELPEDGE